MSEPKIYPKRIYMVEFGDINGPMVPDSFWHDLSKAKARRDSLSKELECSAWISEIKINDEEIEND